MVWKEATELGSTRTIECDIRFNKHTKWYDGSGSPAADPTNLLAMHESGTVSDRRCPVRGDDDESET
jgi:hypothetical protein